MCVCSSVVAKDTLLQTHTCTQTSMLAIWFLDFNVPSVAYGCLWMKYTFEICLYQFKRQVTKLQVKVESQFWTQHSQQQPQPGHKWSVHTHMDTHTDTHIHMHVHTHTHINSIFSFTSSWMCIICVFPTVRVSSVCVCLASSVLQEREWLVWDGNGGDILFKKMSFAIFLFWKCNFAFKMHPVKPSLFVTQW